MQIYRKAAAARPAGTRGAPCAYSRARTPNRRACAAGASNVGRCVAPPNAHLGEERRAGGNSGCCSQDGERAALSPLRNLALSIGSACVVLSPLSGGDAWADMVQTVPASQVTQMARALPQQKVEKGKVWLVFVGGAATLFATTLALENNSSLFPAISRANRAASDAKKAAEAMEKRVKLEETTATEVRRQTAVVEEGLREARARVLSSERPAASAAASAVAQEQVQASAAAAQQGAAGTSTGAMAPHASEATAALEEEAAKQDRLASFVSGMATEGKQPLSSLKAQSQAQSKSPSV